MKVEVELEKLDRLKSLVDSSMKKLAYLDKQLRDSKDPDPFSSQFLDLMLLRVEKDKNLGSYDKQAKKKAILELQAQNKDIRASCDAARAHSEPLSDQERKSLQALKDKLKEPHSKDLKDYDSNRAAYQIESDPDSAASNKK